MIKILVVEDDKDLNQLVVSYLKRNNYEVTTCLNALDALDEITKQKFDMIVSDIMMPGMDGFSFAEQIRKDDKQIPILFMTARDDKPSKKLGYQLGIDDYVVKPFDLDLLMMKIAAIIRRTTIKAAKQLIIGNFIMDIDEHMAYLNDDELPLTVREFDLLFKLLSYPKKTFTRSTLMEEFWGFDTSATSRTVDVYMAKLRDKTLECDGFEIITVHGLGYKAVLK